MENFDRLRNLLKKTYPDYRISVRRQKMKDYHGRWYKKDDGTYVILINRKDSQSVQMDTLLHEWAHVITDGLTTEHTVAWGMEYAKLYQLYEKEVLT
jgi:Zn-dependent peptidase ImmA (M78 family)